MRLWTSPDKVNKYCPSKKEKGKKKRSNKWETGKEHDVIKTPTISDLMQSMKRRDFNSSPVNISVGVRRASADER